MLVKFISQMKRIVLCVIFVIGIAMFAFAEIKSKGQNEYDVLSEKLTAYALQTDTISTIMKKYLENGKKQVENIKRLEQEVEQLKSDKSQAIFMITSPVISRMLVEYPLMVRYDSALIAHTLELVDKYEIGKIKENSYYKFYIPLLEKYNEYNQEIYDIVNMILTQYVRFGNAYTIERFETDFKGKSYYKKSTQGEQIPYLENKIAELRNLITEEGRLTSGNLEYLLLDLIEE